MATPIFNKYEIIRRLTVGGMGEIFLARQTGVAGFDRLVILKSLLPHLAAQAKFVRQFLDEARVAARLSHPNIVAIFEVGLWEGTYFIAMEYIHGATLSKVVQQAVANRTLIPIEITARIMHDAAVALDHAHRAVAADGSALSIVHRDVSPQNIMVRADGITKVVDFGIAKAAIVAGRTATGELKGKLRYMPPEQLAGDSMDGRSDQFALGVCFWEMCTRRHLFNADNPAQLVREIGLGPIPSPAPYTSFMPVEIERVILRMLERDPARRFPSLREVSSVLRAYLSALPSPVSEPEVAQYIQSTLGDQIDAVTADLTPGRDANFVISLQSATETGTPVVQYDEGEATIRDRGRLHDTVPMTLEPAPAIAARRRRRVGLAVFGVAAAIAVFGITSWPGAETAAGGEQAALPVTTADAARPSHPAEPPPLQPESPPMPPTLRLASTPEGASVWLDDAMLGRTPLDIRTLPPDVTHGLVVRKKGFVDAALQVRLGAGEQRSQKVELRRELSSRGPRRPVAPSTGPAPTGVAARDGSLTIKTTPWTEVEIDGVPRGTTPLFKLPLAAGEHSVRLVNRGKEVTHVQTVRIRAGELQKLDLDLTKR
ncbi:MAG: serine/threonine-protein kinase [Pseudomonadota bacterium]